MHDAAREWIEAHPVDPEFAVLEVGSRDVNGTLRDLFGEQYTGMDVREGPNVDIVGDAALMDFVEKFDVVVCTEVFEHSSSWPMIVERIHAALVPGGRAIMTMAAPPRAPHSVNGEETPEPWEYYANVKPASFVGELMRWFDRWTVDYLPEGDLRAIAWRQPEWP